VISRKALRAQSSTLSSASHRTKKIPKPCPTIKTCFSSHWETRMLLWCQQHRHHWWTAETARWYLALHRYLKGKR